MEKNYDDIIGLEHPGLFGRMRMSMEQRAAQFSPFAALSGYGAMLEETTRHTSQKPVLDKDARDELDMAITSLLRECQKQEVMVEVGHFRKDSIKEGGEITLTKGCLKEVDLMGRCLILKDREAIRLDDILSLKQV